MFALTKKVYFTSKDINHEVELVEKESCTHDVRHLRFRLSHPEMISGIRPGNHIKAIAEVDGRKLSRFYSPVSDPDERGYFDLVLKIYPVSEVDPKLGQFSRHMDSLRIGDKLTMSGPFGQLSYEGHGRFKWNDGAVKQFVHIAMIAGGTGITPMVQIIRSVVRNPADGTDISLLYTNKREEDVVFRSELEGYATIKERNFSLTLTLTRVKPTEVPNWPYSFGRIDREMVSEALPAPADNVLVLICGRLDMNKVAKGLCEELGFTHIHVY